MTATEAIDELDAMHPNQFERAQKRRWLTRCEARLTREIVNTHQGGEDAKSVEITAENEGEALRAPAPYDELYVWYLQAQVDQANGELTRYNNSVALFNQAYQDYADAVNRTAAPVVHRTAIRYY